MTSMQLRGMEVEERRRKWNEEKLKKEEAIKEKARLEEEKKRERILNMPIPEGKMTHASIVKKEKVSDRERSWR